MNRIVYTAEDEFGEPEVVDPPAPFRLETVLSGEEFLRQVCYPVIVEAWDKRTYGRARRRWLAEFTEAERRTLSYWYTRFHEWHLRTGTPQEVRIRNIGVLGLLQRACNFFAGLV